MILRQKNPIETYNDILQYLMLSKQNIFSLDSNDNCFGALCTIIKHTFKKRKTALASLKMGIEIECNFHILYDSKIIDFQQR